MEKMEEMEKALEALKEILSGDISKDFMLYLDLQIKSATEAIELMKKQLERLGKAEGEISNIMVRNEIRKISTNLAIDIMKAESNLEQLTDIIEKYKEEGKM